MKTNRDLDVADVAELLRDINRFLTALMSPLGKFQLYQVLHDPLARAKCADMVERTREILELLDSAARLSAESEDDDE